MILHYLAKTSSKTVRIEKIAKADSSSRGLVFIGGADATACCADRFFSTSTLPSLIQGDVIGKDERTRLTDAKSFTGGYIACFKHGQLLEERIGSQDHPIANQAHYSISQNSRGNQM